MHPIEQAVRDFFSKNEKPDDKLLDECLSKIRAAIVDKFHTAPDNRWRLRMSNIGRDTRQIMLEKKYGRVNPEPEFLLKMLTGDIQEQILVYILKSAGLEIETGGEVSIVVNDLKIDGTWDVKLKVDNKIYDVKTASEWSFNNKFVDYKTLTEDDSFGYVDQLIGYCEGEQAEPGGWIVLNKSTGEFKVIDYPKTLEEVREGFFVRITKKIATIYSGEMPACTGIEAETFYQKPTGNKIIGGNCRFCPYKKLCHPKATLEDSRVSKARIKPKIWYIN